MFHSKIGAVETKKPSLGWVFSRWGRIAVRRIHRVVRCLVLWKAGYHDWKTNSTPKGDRIKPPVNRDSPQAFGLKMLWILGSISRRSRGSRHDGRQTGEPDNGRAQH